MQNTQTNIVSLEKSPPHTFDPIEFCIKVGQLKIELAVAKSINDIHFHFAARSELESLINPVATLVGQGATEWDPIYFLTNYPELADLFAKHKMRFSPSCFDEEMESIQEQCYPGGGQSDVLFFNKFSAAIDYRLNEFRFKPELAEQFLKVAIQWGYRNNNQGQDSSGDSTFNEHNNCLLTGIEVNCCPCGQHE